MPQTTPVQLLVSVGDDTTRDQESIDAETRRMIRELSELEVDSVRPAPAGAAPAGAKVGEAAAIGTVLVTLLPAVLPKLIEFIQAWTMRGAGRRVKIRATAGDRTFDVEYSPGATSSDELTELLAALSQGLDATNGSA
jgi:hypothetical protein